MKLALVLLSACVAISHQQYFRDPRVMFGLPWLWMPIQPERALFNDHGASNEENVYGGQLTSGDGRNNINEEDEEGFQDTQSRVKSISRYRPRPYLNNDQQNARFLFNLYGSTAGSAFSNPLLKTATFTSTQTLTLISLVRCIPISEVIANPPACRRKREDGSSQHEDNQFMIIDPSKTLQLMPTALISTDRSSGQLWSSKDDVTSGQISSTDYNSREKRFFFVNKNQFVVSSTITTFSFVSVTSTATVNFLNPPPAAAVVPCAPVAPVVCVNCLPPGFVVCPAPAG